jgi:hypothetical protein
MPSVDSQASRLSLTARSPGEQHNRWPDKTSTCGRATAGENLLTLSMVVWHNRIAPVPTALPTIPRWQALESREIQAHSNAQRRRT